MWSHVRQGEAQLMRAFSLDDLQGVPVCAYPPCCVHEALGFRIVLRQTDAPQPESRLISEISLSTFFCYLPRGLAGPWNAVS